MKTHEVEIALGVTKQTLIYYEKEGLVVPSRNENNYRDYSTNDVETLKLILLLRSMEITIDEIKLIMNNKLSIRDALDRKQEFIEKSKIKLDNIDEKIKNYIKRHQVEVFFDNKVSDNYETVVISDDVISFNDTKINCHDINRIDVSMCSSLGGFGTYYIYILNYYIDLDICSSEDTYSFQIMNNSVINELFEYFKSNNLVINDPMKLVEAYRDYDMVSLNKYLDRHFKQWAKEYNLDNPRDNFLTSQKESLINPLNAIKHSNKSASEIVKGELDDIKKSFSRFIK